MARKPPTDYEPSVILSRQEFLSEYWNPKPGEHVTFVAPTQNGKTTMIFDLLAHLPPQQHPPIMLVMKPRDRVVSAGIKRLDYRIVRTWPPAFSKFRPNPPGYALWPKHVFVPDLDDQHLRTEMRKALLYAYKQGDTIVIADETYGLNQVGLGEDVTAIHTRGAGMGVSMWCATQKPTHIGSWAYSQAEYLFLGYDPDERARDRFEEIGGIDPGIVAAEVAKLQKYEWLFLQRTGRKRAIIRAS